MLRQVKIALATFAGMLTGAFLLVLSELTGQRDYPIDPFTGERFTPLSWVQGVVTINMPLVGILLIASLALLELVQPRIKAPRIAFFVLGALAIAAVVGAMFAFGAAQFFAFDPALFERVFGYDTPMDMITRMFVLPALVASAGYVWLTKDMVPGSADPVPQEPYAVPVPSPVTPVLQEAPDTDRMIAIMTSPHDRIGQRAFLYALRLWWIAVTIWVIAPILIAGFLGMDDETGKYVVAAFGWVALFWSAFCITANRVHDLNLSAVWAAAPALVALLWVIVETPADAPLVSTSTATHLVIALLLCYLLTAALLIIRKGDPSPNQYGAASI